MPRETSPTALRVRSITVPGTGEGSLSPFSRKRTFSLGRGITRFRGQGADEEERNDALIRALSPVTRLRDVKAEKTRRRVGRGRRVRHRRPDGPVINVSFTAYVKRFTRSRAPVVISEIGPLLRDRGWNGRGGGWFEEEASRGDVYTDIPCSQPEGTLVLGTVERWQ